MFYYNDWSSPVLIRVGLISNKRNEVNDRLTFTEISTVLLLKWDKCDMKFGVTLSVGWDH